MAQTVQFQDPGEGIHDAEVVEIRVSPGEKVEQGQVILIVETDKANFEVESPFSGTVEDVGVSVGDRIEVGQKLLALGAAAGDGKAEEAKKIEGATKTEEDEGEGRERPERSREGRTGEDEDGPEPDTGGDREDPEAGELAPAGPEESRRGNGQDREAGRRETERPVPASPATRRLARELGVDLRDVSASGEDGRVLAHDVRGHARGESARVGHRGGQAEPKPAELPDFSRWGPVERSPLRSVRRTIARRMAHAWESVPHVTHTDHADITELDAFRRRQSERLEGAGDKLTLTVLAMSAAAAVLREYPRFNASLDPQREELVYKRYFHIGVAVDTDRGLVVPAVRDVDRKSVRELAHEIADLAEAARGGTLGRDEMMRGTFTITNVGAIGGLHFTPIINHPQVAILGLGRARLEPRVVETGGDLEITPRLMLPICLAFDHRVNDGADAARFVNRLIGILADPERFALMV